MCLNGRAFAAAALACIVTAGAPVPSSAHQATGSLAGRVIHAETRAPLGRARITLTSPALAAPRVAISSGNGTFEFRNLPAGRYTLAATRTGFVAYHSGERGTDPAVPLSITDGQKLGGIELALDPAGVIVGQVLDEDGAPFAGAAVDALAPRLESGQSLVSVGRTATDDRGGFRLTGLPAGQYYVSAFDPAFASVGDETGALRYVPTYYPGVVLIEEATRVGVTPGVEPIGTLVLKLRIVRPARVSGRVATPDRRQLITGAVMMAPLGGNALAPIATQDALIQPDGTFSFRNVPPGRYQIRARGEVDTHGVSRFAAFSVVVQGRDIENVELTLTPGAIVEGRIVVEGVHAAAPPDLTRLLVRAPFADGSSFGDALTGNVAANGTYRIRGLMTGLHYITLEGLQAPWVLKQVTYRGQDITDEGVDVQSNQALKNLRVTITDVATELDGIVRDGSGQPVSDALVLVISALPQFSTRTSPRVRVLRSDAGGHYQIRGLPAGEYRAIATLGIDESELQTPETLQALGAAGIPLTLATLQQLTLDLPLTPVAPVRRTPTR